MLSIAYPCRGCTLHRIPAIRSLIQLIARRAIGVSENLRKLYGVGFGIASVSGPYELKMDGSPEVRRFFSIACGPAADTPATRRHAPRTASAIFMIFSLPQKCSDTRIIFCTVGTRM